MDIKEITEQLKQITEAKTEEGQEFTIDFDSIGCGFEVATGTSEDEYLTIFLEGFSFNNREGLEYKSDVKTGYTENISRQERIQRNRDFVAKKAQVRDALLKAANEFDAKVAEIMESFGFTK